MRLLFASFVIAIVLGIVVSVSAQTGKQIAVKINSETSVDRGKLRISFAELIEDSRCPKGTTCVWAGEGKIKIGVKKAGSNETFVELSTMNGRNTVAFGPYQISLIDLKPRPAANVRIDRRSYTAMLEIRKSGR
jgi:hypothetical protein